MLIRRVPECIRIDAEQNSGYFWYCLKVCYVIFLKQSFLGEEVMNLNFMAGHVADSGDRTQVVCRYIRE